MSSQLTGLRKEITDTLKSKTFLRIRNNVAFHYPERKFEFRKELFAEDGDGMKG